MRPALILLVLSGVLAAVAVWLSASPDSLSGVSVSLSHGGPESGSPYLAAAEMPRIRVLLSEDPPANVTVRVEGPYRVTEVDSWRVLAQGRELPPSAVVANNGCLKVGSRQFEAAAVELEAVRRGTIYFGGENCSGSLRFIADSNRAFSVVNVVSLEEFVASALAQEVAELDLEKTNCDGPGDAALEAIAIALRSQAVFLMKAVGKNRPWDVEHVAGDAAITKGACRAATDRTRGIVATYRGRLFHAYRTRVCGGRTADGHDVLRSVSPSLIGVPCEYCQDAEKYRWQRVIPSEELWPALISHFDRMGLSLGAIERIEEGAFESGDGNLAASRQTADRMGPALTTIRVVGEHREATLSAHEFRAAVVGLDRLPSSLFTIETLGDQISFSGRGCGHGVGLCVSGACRQAELGYDAVQILAYYYPGSSLTPVR